MGALIALGLVLRVLWVLLVPSRPVGDFALYRESAAYLVEHHALDPQFIYMPGYVFLLAAVEALGGGQQEHVAGHVDELRIQGVVLDQVGG